MEVQRRLIAFSRWQAKIETRTDAIGDQRLLISIRNYSEMELRIVAIARHAHLTVNRIIFDSIVIEPIRTENGERCASRAIVRTDRTGTVFRRLIHAKIQSTGTDRREKRVNRFKAPVTDILVRKQLGGRCEITG